MGDIDPEDTLTKDRLALENWERWMKIRKKQFSSLCVKLDTEPSCLLMNREFRNWPDNEIWVKEAALDSEFIKSYRCRCGKVKCSYFWKTVDKDLPGIKNLLAEVYFSPHKLTYENDALRPLLEDGYIGHPRLMLQEKGIVGQKCLEKSLKNWKEIAYIQGQGKDAQDVTNADPIVDELIVIGKKIIQKEEVNGKQNIPGIIVEDYFINHREPDDSMPILCIGKLLLKGDDKEGVHWTMEFTANVRELQAKYIKFKNKGEIAINYYWKKINDCKNRTLPIRVTKHMLTRFFFDNSNGILLPGQTYQQTFWFRSRTPGVFKEKWLLVTKPFLPKMCFCLEGVASKTSGGEKHENNVIDNYLKKLASETMAREMTEVALHRIPSSQMNKMPHCGYFSEREIFMHINPLLYYKRDVVREVKRLHARFFKEEWNLSMDDLCDKLIEVLRNESEKKRKKIFKKYSKLLKKLQKKPVTMNMTDLDWEMFKFHLSYLLLSAGIAEMEKSLNYQSWGLKPPNAPKGTNEDYEGDFEDSHSEDKPWISDKEDGGDQEENEVSDDSTEIDEAKLAKLEKEIRKEFGEYRLSKTKRIDTNLCLGIRFTKDFGAQDEEQEDEHMGEEGEEEFEEENLQVGEEEKEIAMKIYYSDDPEEEEIFDEAVQEEEPTLGDLVYGEKPTERELDDDDFFDEDIAIVDEPFVEEEEAAEDENQVTQKLKDITETIKNYPPKDRLKPQTQPVQQPVSQAGTRPLKGRKSTQGKRSKSVAESSEPKTQVIVTESNKPKKYMGGDPAPFIKLEKEAPPWVRKRFIAFAEIQWRQILSDTIDDIVALVESINIYKGSPSITNIQLTERMQTSS